MNRLIVQLAAGTVLAASLVGSAEPVARVDFGGLPLGPATREALMGLWQSPKWASPGGRAFIVEDAERGKVLRVLYPKGGVGPGENGMQFLADLPPADEYYLSYRLKFEEGFDFKLGGKLPGLTSGGGTFTGGRRPAEGEGWSTRYMWGRGGRGTVYFYSVDMPGKWGQGLRLEGLTFQPGVWHRLTQRIRLNTGDRKDGILEVWFDGKKVYESHEMRFRLGDRGRIDSFYFSTFHGGNSPDWGPTVDCAARFDDIQITVEPPEHLGKDE